MIQRARREFRYGKATELDIVRLVIRAGSVDSERGDLLRQVSRLLDKAERCGGRYPSVIS